MKRPPVWLASGAWRRDMAMEQDEQGRRTPHEIAAMQLYEVWEQTWAQAFAAEKDVEAPTPMAWDDAPDSIKAAWLTVVDLSGSRVVGERAVVMRNLLAPEEFGLSFFDDPATTVGRQPDLVLTRTQLFDMVFSGLGAIMGQENAAAVAAAKALREALVVTPDEPEAPVTLNEWQAPPGEDVA